LHPGSVGCRRPSAPSAGCGVGLMLGYLLTAFAGALIVAGVAFIFWPAGLIVAGLLLLAGLHFLD
jgi:hypothetical protein